MKLSKRDIGLLIILLGIIAFLVCYLAIYNPTIADNEILNGEIATLTPELNALKAKEARKPEFEEGIENSRAAIQGIIDGFPRAVRAEDFIMYAVTLENVVGINTDGMNFSQPELIIELEDVIGPDGEVEFEATNAYGVIGTINAIFTYDHMKEVVKNVYERSVRSSINTFTINYNAEYGVLSGTVAIEKYFITSEDDPYIETYVPPMRTGVPNPFNSLDELPDLEEVTEEVDEDDDAPTPTPTPAP